MKKSKKMLTAALAAGALGASILPLQAAVAGSSPPSAALSYTIADTATSIAKGAAIEVEFEVTCAPGTYIYEQSVEVSQRVQRGNLARGYAYDYNPQINCDGTVQSIPMTIFADSVAFKNGVAIARSSVYGCTVDDYWSCEYFVETKTIDIKNSSNGKGGGKK